LGLIVFMLYVTGNDVYKTPEIEADRALLREMVNRRVLLLGSSHGRDLVLSTAGLDGVDLSHDGQDLFEMAYIARSVKAKAPKLDTVFVTLSYFSFVFDNAAYLSKGVQTRVDRRVGLYRVFGRLSFIPGDSPQYLKAMLAPVITRDHYRKVFGRLPDEVSSAIGEEDEGDEAEFDEEDDDPAPEKRRHSRRGLPGYFQRYARGRCHLYADLTHVMQHNHPGLVGDTKQLMLRLTRELEAASVRVVFFTPPFLLPYNACFDQRQQRLTRETGRWLAQATRARYFDFSTDPSFVNHERYFKNTDHLSRPGKAAFSKLFAAALAKEARP
jgi:hypothetical protein